MTLYDAGNQPVSSAANALARDAAPEPTPPKRRNYKPSPGRVTVLRDEVSETIEHGDLKLYKESEHLEMEKAFSIYATVAVVGDPLPNGMEPWFGFADKVTIEPGLFREVELGPGLTVWNGPWAGVTGVFTEEGGAES